MQRCLALWLSVWHYAYSSCWLALGSATDSHLNTPNEAATSNVDNAEPASHMAMIADADGKTSFIRSVSRHKQISIAAQLPENDTSHELVEPRVGCQSALELEASIATARELKAKAEAEVKELRQVLQSATFGMVDDEISQGTWARQYSEPVCLCHKEAHEEVEGQPSDNSFEDDTCMHRGSTRVGEPPCQHGFPFFRMTSNALDADMCFMFCVEMGLDVFAIVDRTTCRCGVSEHNIGAWGSIQPDEALIAPNLDDKPLYTSDCHIMAARYLGLVDGFTPVDVLASTDDEQKYIRSIMLQKDIRLQDDAPKLLDLDTSEDGQTGWMLVQSSEDANRYINERCTPGQASCAPWALFPKSGSRAVVEIYLQTNGLQFETPNSWSNSLPESTRSTFRQAMRFLEDVACVEFREVSTPGAGWEKRQWKWGVIAGKMEGDEDYCYVSMSTGVGRQSFVNLGWCDSEAYIGNMVHELLHALGMNHEMKRPDAWEAFTDAQGRTHGPYLEWVKGGELDDQLKADPNSYVGSLDVGWADYDFDSIMHYGTVRNEWETEPDGANNFRTGQRKAMSNGDILQLLDYYRCTEDVSITPSSTGNGGSGGSSGSGGNGGDGGNGGGGVVGNNNSGTGSGNGSSFVPPDPDENGFYPIDSNGASLACPSPVVLLLISAVLQLMLRRHA